MLSAASVIGRSRFFEFSAGGPPAGAKLRHANAVHVPSAYDAKQRRKAST
jgi:hypothetical protein